MQSKTIFCPQCGAKHSAACNFCTSCGHSLRSLASTPKKSSSKISVINNSEDDDQPTQIPSIDKLDVEIQINKRKETIADIAGTQRQEFVRETQNLSQEELIKQYKKEAGFNKGGRAESVTVGGNDTSDE